jgi:nicotinate-nucleotide pyrophosphorylase (carboxylating)
MTLDARVVLVETLDAHPTLRGAVARFGQDFDDDLGPERLDITSWALVPADATVRAAMRVRSAGVTAGFNLLPAVLDAHGGAAAVTLHVRDGSRVEAGATIAELHGPLRDVLAVERPALNMVGHLSGVATLTRRYVDAVAGTRTAICETRKTLPGLRALQKYATSCGGATPHRYGLFDAVLIKDNHLAHVPVERLGEAVRDAAARARKRVPRLKFVEVEVDTLAQLDAVLGSGVDLVLLDNMDHATLREAVRRRDERAPAVKLEASGGVNLDTVRAIAHTGVDRISVGALTHSAAGLDVGLDVVLAAGR